METPIKIGYEKIKALVIVLVGLFMEVDYANSDGKIDRLEWFSILGSVGMKAPRVIQMWNTAWIEIKDFDFEETHAFNKEVETEIRFSNDRTEAYIELAIRLLSNIAAFVKKIKGIPAKAEKA